MSRVSWVRAVGDELRYEVRERDGDEDKVS